MPTDPNKRAVPDHPIHDLLAERFSPYAFDPRPVEREKLLSCLEAARWAASSFNEQPWSILVAERRDEAEFDRMVGCLMEANQGWAGQAGVLMLTVISRTFSRNDKPNRVAEHDLGLAAANLTVQATALGLHVHQMAGVDLEKVRRTYDIPDSHHPFTALGLGYATDHAKAADLKFAERDRAPRSRKKLAEFVFAGRWNEPAALARP